MAWRSRGARLSERRWLPGWKAEASPTRRTYQAKRAGRRTRPFAASRSAASPALAPGGRRISTRAPEPPPPEVSSMVARVMPTKTRTPAAA
jgi:hypothetical protein